MAAFTLLFKLKLLLIYSLSIIRILPHYPSTKISILFILLKYKIFIFRCTIGNLSKSYFKHLDYKIIKL